MSHFFKEVSIKGFITRKSCDKIYFDIVTCIKDGIKRVLNGYGDTSS
jgi:hypothetical protein